MTNLLRQILTSYAEFQEANLARSLVTDEADDNQQIDLLLSELASALLVDSLRVWATAWLCHARTFNGVGGRKIFRDEVYGPLRFVFSGGSPLL
jgi:hypothetical protein